jgi:hypothetical protein
VGLPDEDGAEFAALEAALIEELAPQGALQSILVGRIAVASWRLARADRLEVEVFELRSYADAGPGLALMRDGNGTRSIETLMRYRGAAMAELTRSLRTLKALQAEQAATLGAAAPARVPQPRVAPGDDPSLRTERTRAPRRASRRAKPTRAPARLRPARPARARPRPPRARGALDAEPTRAGARGPAGAHITRPRAERTRQPQEPSHITPTRRPHDPERRASPKPPNPRPPLAPRRPPPRPAAPGAGIPTVAWTLQTIG